MNNIYSILLILFISYIGRSQEIADHAIGLRLGDSRGFGTEITYQKAHKKNRIELDLGLKNSNTFKSTQLVGLYQWVWQIESSFNWYVGPGVGIGSWRHTKNYIHPTNNGSHFFVMIAGNIGVEYDFDIPLLLSLDFRPQIGIIDYGDNSNADIAFSARYQF